MERDHQVDDVQAIDLLEGRAPATRLTGRCRLRRSREHRPSDGRTTRRRAGYRRSRETRAAALGAHSRSCQLSRGRSCRRAPARDTRGRCHRGDVVEEERALLGGWQVERSGQGAQPHRRNAGAHDHRGDRKETALPAADEHRLPGPLPGQPERQKPVGRDQRGLVWPYRPSTGARHAHQRSTLMSRGGNSFQNPHFAWIPGRLAARFRRFFHSPAGPPSAILLSKQPDTPLGARHD